jgi:hypothetical protein
VPLLTPTTGLCYITEKRILGKHRGSRSDQADTCTGYMQGNQGLVYLRLLGEDSIHLGIRYKGYVSAIPVRRATPDPF